MGGEELLAVVEAEEALRAAVVEEAEHLVEEGVGVDEADGLLVDAELGPGDDFEKFVEGAEASWEDDEGVGVIGHHHFAFVHGLDDVEFVEAFVSDFARVDELGDDADDAAVAGEGGIGDGAHKAHGTAPIDQGEVSGGDGGAEHLCGVAEGGVVAVAGTAEDAEALEWHKEEGARGGGGSQV